VLSFLLDERGEGVSRHDARERVNEMLNRPVDEAEAFEYDREAHAKKNVGANPHLTGGDDDPFLAKPVNRG
jgi:hypothetical protein